MENIGTTQPIKEETTETNDMHRIIFWIVAYIQEIIKPMQYEKLSLCLLMWIVCGTASWIMYSLFPTDSFNHLCIVVFASLAITVASVLGSAAASVLFWCSYITNRCHGLKYDNLGSEDVKDIMEIFERHILPADQTPTTIEEIKRKIQKLDN